MVPQRGLAVRDIRKLHIGRDLMRMFNFPLISTIRHFLHGLLPASRRAIIRELDMTPFINSNAHASAPKTGI